MSRTRRVAITGVGMATPVGNNASATWQALLAAAARTQSGCIHARSFPTHIGAEVKGFSATLVREPKLLKFASRSYQFALTAAEEALEDSGIWLTAATGSRWGCCVGAGMMGVSFPALQTVHAFCGESGEFDPQGFLHPEFPADPVGFCQSQPNAGLALLTRYFGIRGYATAVHTACASGGRQSAQRLKCCAAAGRTMYWPAATIAC